MKWSKEPAGGRPLALWSLAIIALAILCASAQWWLPPGPARQVVAFLLLWILSAAAWYLWLGEGTVEAIVTAAGLGLLGNVVGALLLQMVPGPIPRWQLAVMAIGNVSLPMALSQVWPGPQRTTMGQGQASADEMGNSGALTHYALLAGILVLAAILRLGNAQYKEFQGDEGVIMVRAAAILQGDDAELYLHEKGPVEILLPVFGWGLGGSSNEFWARAPFFWAGWLAVLGIYALARRWFSPRAGLLAALFFAVNGFALAFSRIVQYQGLVMLWTILALLHASRYRETGRARRLLLVALFLAGGLLAHYDAVLAVPAVAWLLLARVIQEREIQWGAWLSALLVGTFVTALFYIPYVANPAFAGTGRYLLQDRLGGNLFSWSGPEVWRMVTFYNSTYYAVGLIILALAGVWLCRRRHHWFPAVLFAGVAAFFYLFIVADPRTHVYTLFPGAVMLAAAGAAALVQRMTSPPLSSATLVMLTLYGAISFVYVYLLFVDATPERQRTWGQNRPPLYATTWEEPPMYGLFGFPHQAGWRLAPELVQRLPYASNEEPEITSWYMGQAAHTHCADYGTFLLAENAQDQIPYDAQQLQARHLQRVITVNGRPSLRIYGREPVEEVPEFEATVETLWRTPQEVAPPAPSFEYAVDANLEGKVRLLGYDIHPMQVQPGGTLTVTLYWEALAPFERNYQVFVHLYEGSMWAQDDGAPECDINPTTRWEPGQVIRDPHLIQLPQEPPPGDTIPLLVGMYEVVTGDRLHEAGTANDALRLTNVPVRQ